MDLFNDFTPNRGGRSKPRKSGAKATESIDVALGQLMDMLQSRGTLDLDFARSSINEAFADKASEDSMSPEQLEAIGALRDVLLAMVDEIATITKDDEMPSELSLNTDKKTNREIRALWGRIQQRRRKLANLHAACAVAIFGVKAKKAESLAPAPSPQQLKRLETIKRLIGELHAKHDELHAALDEATRELLSTDELYDTELWGPLVTELAGVDLSEDKLNFYSSRFVKSLLINAENCSDDTGPDDDDDDDDDNEIVDEIDDEPMLGSSVSKSPTPKKRKNSLFHHF